VEKVASSVSREPDEGALSSAQKIGNAPSPDLHRCARKSTSPRTRGEVRMKPALAHRGPAPKKKKRVEAAE